MDKRSSLLQRFVNYGRKMFYNIGPRTAILTRTPASSRSKSGEPHHHQRKAGLRPQSGESSPASHPRRKSSPDDVSDADASNVVSRRVAEEEEVEFLARNVAVGQSSQAIENSGRQQRRDGPDHPPQDGPGYQRGVYLTKLSSSSLMKEPNKLECLPVASLSSLF